MKRLLFLATTLAAVLVSAGTASALPSNIILAHDATTGSPVVMSALDGSGLSAVPCGGDLTQSAAPRYFLTAQLVGGAYPDGRKRSELIAWDETCTAATQLTSDPDLERDTATWSPDANRVAFGGTRYDPTTGQPIEQGIFVGAVSHDSTGRPIAITGEHLAVALTTGSLGTLSWASDDQRVAYQFNLGTPVAPQWDVFVANVDTGATTNDTLSPTINELQPAFSSTANKLAYVRKTSRNGVYRNDVFVLDLTTGATTQATNKSLANVAQISHPAWSPDGQSIAFDGYAIGLGTATADIFRIRADGTQKAIDLTTGTADSMLAPQWRR